MPRTRKVLPFVKGMATLIPGVYPALRPVDLVFSQAALEHADDPAFIYDRMYQWLKPGGFMSHMIDYRCHGTATEWNGHWTCSDVAWKLIRGRRPFLMNRWMQSWHVDSMEQAGFRIVAEHGMEQSSGLDLRRCALRFQGSEVVLTTAVALVKARKPWVRIDAQNSSRDSCRFAVKQHRQGEGCTR